MALVIRHALPLDSNLMSYLTSMTVSWTRKKIPIQLSENGLAYWNGRFISVPDLRNSSYKFVVDHSLDKQFSFYSALVFHECMHAKFLSHKADITLLSNNLKIPNNFYKFALFLNNVFEDGRIERLGLIKRRGSVIYHQLFAFNVLISESNWENFEKLNFANSIDEFLNHIINQLFDIVLLGRNFITDFINEVEEKLINDMSFYLANSVFNSLDPNGSIHATIKFFELLQQYVTFPDQEGQQVHLPNQPDHCGLSHSSGNPKNNDEFNFDNTKLVLEELKNFMNNPFSDLLSNEEYNDDIENMSDTKVGDNQKEEKNQLSNETSNSGSIEETNDQSPKIKGKKKKIWSKKPKRKVRIIPKYSHTQEEDAFAKFIDQSQKNDLNFNPDTYDDVVTEYLDTFGNNMSVPDVETIFENVYENLDNYKSDYIEQIDFKNSYDRLSLIAIKTANYFLELAGINLQKKDGVGNQKIIIGGQKSGKLELSGNSLSQLLAGNKYIYKKEMPAKINISLDLIVLIDLTGSMEFQVHCDGRNGFRLDFVNEATIILAETLHILQNIYKLPITYSIIGYNAPNGSQPVLKVIKSFQSPYLGIQHAESIMSLYPDGENCDARAIYESVKLLIENRYRSENKVIFFLSDGGGEQSDETVIKKIKKEFPLFKFTGPKDFTDVIRYAFMKGIATYIFNLESFQNTLHNYDIRLAFNQYYGENFYLVENLSELISIFSKCLIEIFSKR